MQTVMEYHDTAIKIQYLDIQVQLNLLKCYFDIKKAYVCLCTSRDFKVKTTLLFLVSFLQNLTL